jgi:asparagine N-glycosylation enzyme membrane subunit Stt3
MEINKYYDSGQKKEEHHEEAPVESKKNRFDAKVESVFNNKYALIAIALLILILNVSVRVGLLKYQGLFEPDGFFYYSVIRAEINANYHPINYLGISGFPSHNFIGEAPGLPYLTVIFYYLFHGIFNLTALQIMRWMPIIFGMAYAILAYFIAKYISNSKVLGLLAMLFVSISSGGIARTAGGVYRGDSFISLFLLVALLLMLKCFEEKKSIRKYVYATLSAIALSLGIVIWNGSPFIIIVYMFALIFAIAYGFVFADKDALLTCMVLSVTLLLTNILQRVYVAIGDARAGLQLAGNSFFVLWIPILLAAIFAYYIIKNREKILLLSNSSKRIAFLGIILLVGIVILYVAFGGFLQQIASPLGSFNATTGVATNNATQKAIVATTQELQPPTFGFLWSSFSTQLFLAPLGVLLFIIIAILVFKGEKFIKRDHFKLNNVGFLIVLAYLLVTAYLQSSAIRFNALLSIPLAIFAAFAVYVLAKIAYNVEVKNPFNKGAALVLIAIIALNLTLFIFYPALRSSFGVVVIASVAMIVILILPILYAAYSTFTKKGLLLKYVVISFVLVIIIYNLYNTYFQSQTAVQADGINPSFLEAMTWLKNNTPSNATVLALWPDGSVVEGWANRTSYMDSVGGENGTRIYAFANYLFNDSLDTNYLYSIHKPEYLVARNFWYEELGGIAQEGLISNVTAYGYVILSSFNSTNNGTAQFFSFSQTSYPYYKSELIIIPASNASGATQYKAYLGLQNSSRAALMRSIIFFNSSNSAYNIINYSANDTINYTLMVSYSGTQINGAYILGPKLIESNMFKFTFLCNEYECPYSGDGATMKAVYVNGDTRIFKINYTN